jgi:hypothetical protein
MGGDFGAAPPLGGDAQQVVASREAGLICDMAHDGSPVSDGHRCEKWCARFDELDALARRNSSFDTARDDVGGWA